MTLPYRLSLSCQRLSTSSLAMAHDEYLHFREVLLMSAARSPHVYIYSLARIFKLV